MKKMKIVRGTYMECWLVASQQTKPSIIIPYGVGRSQFKNFEEAAQYASEILKITDFKTALKAVVELLDGDREDYDNVVVMVQNALQHETDN